MKQILSTARGVEVLEVPAPVLGPGRVLVEVEYSFVSSGTEAATLSAMQASGRGLVSQVNDGPAIARRLTRHLRDRGIKKTVSAVMGHIEARSLQADRLVPIGYSCAGRVVAVGEGVTLFGPGDRVACAGAGLATHSELVAVPENLVAPVPVDCELRAAASVAVGAVALQAVRRADVRLGESVAVLGLGLVGLLSVQMLKLSGARVIGYDVAQDRADRAVALGAGQAYTEVDALREAVGRSTGHMGADVSLVAASSESSEVVRTALDATRRNGRIVVVGLVGMDLDRDQVIRKEIELVGSSSYGPGRYDDLYEHKGVDYPYAHVRWTEKRNMGEYLRLLAEGRVRTEPLVEEHGIESAAEAYERLTGGEDRPVAVLVRYPTDRALDRKLRTRVEVTETRPAGKVRVAVVGPGRFVRRVHLPILKGMGGGVEIAAVVARTGAAGVEVARQYGAGYASTSFEEVLGDSEIDAVLIGTRHDLHGGMVRAALRAGKHVLVEKPLALTEPELGEIEAIYAEDGGGDPKVLLTGFNRRFSPIIARLRDLLASRKTPMILDYQMNSGVLPADHWLRTEEGGGRNLGEACHIYDLYTHLTGARVVRVAASSIATPSDTHARNENFVATLTFDDGSIGTLTYTTMGSRGQPKELMRVYADERVYAMSDYETLDVVEAGATKRVDGDGSKGHREEVEAFVKAIAEGSGWPIPLWQQLQASRVALEVERQVGGGG